LPARPSAATELDTLPEMQPVAREYKPGRQLFIYAQPHETPRAAVVFVHGGGWNLGEAKMFDPHCRYYASRGCVAITVEYRRANQTGATIFDCIADVKAALRWIRAHAAELGILPNHILAVGDSAGGHLVACAGVIKGLEAPDEDLKISSRPDAMVLFYPVIKTTMPGGWDLARLSEKSGGPAVAARAREFSPVDNVSAGVPPTLIMHGTADKLTPISWSEQFVKAMKEHGNQVELVPFAGQDHAFVTPHYGPDEIIVKALKRMDEFLRSLGWPK
jgi:acetyl esterase/lipase